MRLLVSTFFLGAGMACCCGLPDLPTSEKEADEAAPVPPPVTEPPPAPEPPRPSGPTSVAWLSPQGPDCVLHTQTLGADKRALAILKGACPADAELVVHPDGARALLVEPTGITAIDVARATPERLPALEGVLAARWDDTGTVVALTTGAAPEPSTDPKGKFVTIDGQRLDVEDNGAISLEVGRVHALDGKAWKQRSVSLGYGFEGLSQDQVFASTVRAMVGKAPGFLGERERELGKVIEANPPGPGEWRQDGKLAFQFEWLEGVMPHGPAALKLPDGTWKTLAGFETGALSWEERAEVLWLHVDGGTSAVFDVATGEEKWRNAEAAWLLPLDLTLVAPAVADAEPPPPPPPVGAQPRRPDVATRRAEPRPARAAEERPEPPPAREEVEEETPAYEPPPDLDTPDPEEKRRRRKKNRDR